VLLEKNISLLVVLSCTLILLVFMIENDYLNQLFQFQRISVGFLIYAFLLSLVFGLLLESVKYFNRKKNNQ
jgi:uncharacterized integral membrane protein